MFCMLNRCSSNHQSIIEIKANEIVCILLFYMCLFVLFAFIIYVRIYLIYLRINTYKYTNNYKYIYCKGTNN